jgi:hypothetical protein
MVKVAVLLNVKKNKINQKRRGFMVTKDMLIAMNGQGDLHYGICERYVEPHDGVVHELIRRVQLTGKCRTWTRKPEYFKQPYKYGMYGFYITPDNANNFHRLEDCQLCQKEKKTKLDPNWKNMIVISGTMIESEIVDAIDTNSLTKKSPELKMAIEDFWRATDVQKRSYIFHERIWGILNDIAPDGCYFGAHPGNGTHYGFWGIEQE